MVGWLAGSTVRPCGAPRSRPPAAMTGGPFGDPVVASTQVVALSVSVTWTASAVAVGRGWERWSCVASVVWRRRPGVGVVRGRRLGREAQGQHDQERDGHDRRQGDHDQVRLAPLAPPLLRARPWPRRDRLVLDGRAGVVVAGVELVHERLAVEAEVLRVCPQEALRVGRAGQDVEVLVLEGADIARADSRVRFDLAVAQAPAFTGFPE